MKYLLLCFLLLIPASSFGQAILRNKVTTNAVTGTFTQGEIMSWDVASDGWVDLPFTNSINALINAAMVNPNTVWFATNGTAAGTGSAALPLNGPSNAVAYARATYGHNWTVRGRAGRYTVFGSASTGTHVTNEAAICIHGATNSAIILDDGCTIYSTNWASMVDLWQVDGFVISGGTLEGVKMGTNTTSPSATCGLIDIRNSRNIIIRNQRHLNAPNHGVGPINSIYGATNVTISDIYQENIGMTNGFPGLVSDGAGVVTWGENWSINNLKQNRVLRGIEHYGEGRNITIDGLIQRKIQWDGVCLIGDGGVGISNFTLRGWSFADCEPSSSLSVLAFNNQGTDTKRVTITDFDIDASNLRYGIAHAGSASSGIDTTDWVVGPGVIRNQLTSDFIALTFGSPGSGINSNITIRGVKVTEIYGAAMSLSMQDSLIVDNYLDGVTADGGSAIQIYNLNGKEQRNRILNNYIRPAANAPSGILLSSLNSPATNNLVQGNTFVTWATMPIIDQNALGNNFISWNYTASGPFSGTNANPFRAVFGGNVSIPGTNFAGSLQGTNLIITTNAAATSVTVGTTAPDRWFQLKDITSGTTYFIPAWLNH